MRTITYKNKYGVLEFKVGSYQKVSTIHSKDVNESLFFDIGTAEKIALITENRSIQLCVNSDFKKMFLIHHSASDIAAVCEVTKIEFGSEINATEELDKPSSHYPIWSF